MIKKLELRFTIVAFSVISLVLLVLIIVVNVISINSNIKRADGILDSLVQEQLNRTHEINVPDEFMEKRNIDKEQNRSFEVVLDKDLNLMSTSGTYKNIQDDIDLYQIAYLAVEDNNEFGFVEDFRYLKIVSEENIRIVFLDYSFERQSEQNFIYVSIIAYFAAVLLVMILVRILLKPVMKSIKESYAKQKQFITDASHELKTPLTIISTDMQLIEMESGPSDWIQSVNNQVERMNRLTNELVTLSRMNEENIQVEMGEVNLSSLLNDVVMGFEPAIIAKDRTFETFIDDEIIIKGNYDALERVMSILLNNALKYSNNKGLIKVNMLKKGKKVIVSVMNSVDFIEKGSHPEFFERFYRSDASRNSKAGGFGIGLAVAKATIEEHHGKIEIRSINEKSLEVLITLKI